MLTAAGAVAWRLANTKVRRQDEVRGDVDCSGQAAFFTIVSS